MLKQKVTIGFKVVLQRRDGQFVTTTLYVVALDAFSAEKIMERWFLSPENNTNSAYQRIVSYETVSSRNIVVDLDSVPIKQSVKWVGMEKNGVLKFSCPNCHTEKEEHELTPYCPNCGQKMESRIYPGTESEFGPDSENA